MLFVDTLHLSISSLFRVKRSLRSFLDEQLGDHDLVAIVSTAKRLGVTGQFTRNRHVLRYAIDKLSQGLNLHEKKKSEDLLNVILPAAAANELKRSGRVEPRQFDNVALLFCDIVGFTSFCSKHTAEEVVGGLQNLFVRFEEIIRDHQMEKIKTIGDEFMATAGLLAPNQNPLLSAVRCGLDMAAAARVTKPNWEVRSGVHCGSVVAGIVGSDKYQFDVWGDTVNIAARMTGQGNPGAVTMTHEAWLQVEEDCLGRTLGRVDVKGKGSIEIIECYGLQ